MNEDRQAGFTLVEALVAMTILVLALTSFHMVISGALRSGAASDAAETALTQARNHMERLGRDLTLASASGTYDGDARWQLSVNPIELPNPAGVARAYWVELVVTNGRGAVVANLRTAKIATNQE